MENELKINNAFLSFDKSVIGRRDFFLNYVYCMCISLFFVLPLTAWFMVKMGSLSEINVMDKYFMSMPVLLKFWAILGELLMSILLISNVLRRLNDILGSFNKVVNLAAAFYILGFNCFIYYIIPFKIITILGCINCILLLVLLIKKGKITSKLPYDVTKEFNWGTFFGTWIWGLINKAYVPLWQLILFFTPFGFYFQLICGLKGNEWAFKNKKWKNNVKKFNKSQENQALFWVILNIILIPFCMFILLFMAIFSIFMPADTDKQDGAKGAESRIEKLENILINLTSLYYETYEITENENKFYVLETDWDSYTFKEKKDLLDMGAKIAVMERQRKAKASNSDSYEYYSRNEELNRTKIYSSDNGRLLGEFNFKDSDLDDDKSLKEKINSITNAYKFY